MAAYEPTAAIAAADGPVVTAFGEGAFCRVMTHRPAAPPETKQWWWAYFGGRSPAVPAAPAGPAPVELPAAGGPLMETSALVGGGGAKGGGEAPPGGGAPPGLSEATLATSVFNLCNTVLGAGALQIPAAFAEVGVAGGLVVLTFVYALSVVSGVMLTDAARHVGAERFGGTYGGLVRAVLGEWGTTATNAVVFIAMFGVAIIYFQLLSVLVSAPIAYWMGDTPADYCSFWSDRRTPVYFAVALEAVLCALPTLNMLRHVSLLAVCAMLYMTLITVVRAGQRIKIGPEGDEEFEALALSTGAFRAMAVCTFAFAPHIQMVRLFCELKEPTRERTVRWLGTSFTICWVVYALVGVFGYLTFYSKVGGLVLLDFEVDDVAVVVGRFAVTVSVLAGFPMMMNACVSAADGLVFPHREPSVWGRRLVWLAVCIGASFGIAMVTDDVSFVTGVTGATGLSAAAYLLPCAVYSRLFRGHRELANWRRAAHAVFAIGAVCGAIALIMSILDDIINRDAEGPCSWPANCPPARCCPPGGVYGPNVSVCP